MNPEADEPVIVEQQPVAPLPDYPVQLPPPDYPIQYDPTICNDYPF